jgi:hypothetical protein
MSHQPTSFATRVGVLRDRLDHSLFPVAPRIASSLNRVESAVVVAALLALGAILALLRLGWSASLDTIWAEDGPIYLQAALTDGFWDAVSSPYAGYLVVVPRLIGEVATLVPLQSAAAAISISSALVAALSGFAVWCATEGHIRNPYLRGGMALVTVLAPTAGLEVLDSAAYAPWYMLFATFWLLLWRPRTMWGAGFAGAFVLLTGLSTPGVWFFIPVAILRALAIHDRRDTTIVGLFAMGAAVQVPVVLGQEQGVAEWSHEIWVAYIQRVVDGGFLGQQLGGSLWSDLGLPFLALLCLGVAAGLLAGLRRSTPEARWFVALALTISFVMFVVSAYQRAVGDNLGWGAGNFGGTASRYVLVPALLAVSAGVVLVDSSVRRRGRTAGPSLAIGVTVAVLLLSVATSFDMRGPARTTSFWKASLRSAANKCVAEKEGLAGIATSPPPFGVQIPCDRVASFADAEASRR